MFPFLIYRPSSLKHLSYLLANFWTPDAKNACWLLSIPLNNDWLHLVIWYKMFAHSYTKRELFGP